MRRKIRNSFRLELTLIMVLLLAGTVGVCLLINSVFLEKYYQKSKINVLTRGYETLDGAASAGELYDSAYDVEFDNFCSNSDTTVLIISSDRTILRSSVNDTKTMLGTFMDALFGTHMEGSIKVSTDQYIIEEMEDSRLGSDYLVLYGTMSDGNAIFMRIALEGIRENVKISNRFISFVGLAAIIVAAILAYAVSKRVTTPIEELSDISGRMTNMEFEAKYTSKNKHPNEIDELGQRMNDLSEKLESTISELKSANNELEKDIAAKEEIDLKRREFLSNVSHELKTPLALVSGYAEGLKECVNDDAESRDFYCDVIIDEASKMSNMVKKLLTLGQLESGRETVTMGRFDLTELVLSIMHSSDILLKENEIVVDQAPNQPVYVWADSFLVEEVFTNFFSNALHYVKNEKSIRVYYEKMDTVVRVNVYNSGDNIPEKDIDEIWNKFYKVDKARTREYGGNGIGLSIVKAAMDAMNQQFGVRNESDGVTFWFELDCSKN